ncbi:MAG: SDR family NAD(P)-dependent oxidoreductase [Planctomycetia bacterium]|nr:SDR family NAD(P)-dependent oxidoreductase [Planctomycetia bacterium]
MPRRKIEGARALVTGASSGIGRAIALELARQGADVVVVARREERLKEVVEQIRGMGRKAAAVSGDVTKPETRSAALAAAREHLGGLDILVNNAGIAVFGPLVKAEAWKMRRIIEVNVLALVELTREALPMLRASQGATIVNVGSILGRLGMPNLAVYSASKFAIRGFSDALRAELARDKIGVLLVSPATTDTEIWDKMPKGESAMPFKAKTGVSPELVARKTVAGIRRGAREVVPGGGAKLVYWLNALFPWAVSWTVTRK